MTNPFTIQPALTVLSAEQIQTIHQDSLKILFDTGIRVDSPQIVERFRQKTGDKMIDGNRVRIPPELVEWVIKSAPSVIDIFDRTGKHIFSLGNDRIRFGIGVTTLFYQDPVTDDVTPFARRHMQELVRLGHALPNFDVISTVGIVQDVDADLTDLYGTLEMAANTTKPLVLLVSKEERYPDVLNMLEHLAGDLASKPWVISYFNPVTPLVMNKGTIDKMEDAIRRGLPVIFSNYSMAGASTPITAGGTLVLMMAELLAGLTISQLIKEGAPIILGMLPAFFDMKTMMNFYDPLSLMLNLSCAEMMAHYHLPHCGTSGSGTGWGPDLLAAETYWMNHLTACMSKVGLCPFVGDTLGSKAISAVNLVYVHEIISQALRFADGFSIAEEQIGLDDIQKAGPGGSFLSAKLTMKNYRTAYYTSPFFPRWSMEKWQAQNRPPAVELLRKYTVELLSQLSTPADHDDFMARGESFIRSTNA
ncbi:MAG: trimethylamine methyltransferase family protein [Anaerolineales bacterium]|nr:trimethylamine methyltransferase family protein [Anaerolineales bacterium]